MKDCGVRSYLLRPWGLRFRSQNLEFMFRIVWRWVLCLGGDVILRTALHICVMMYNVKTAQRLMMLISFWWKPVFIPCLISQWCTHPLSLFTLTQPVYIFSKFVTTRAKMIMSSVRTKSFNIFAFLNNTHVPFSVLLPCVMRRKSDSLLE